ncbi:antirestriction protein ArdA [Mesorhizobium sp. M0145]|uniref:antirestriction protein ArdA n=1 Tax=Mesorhizobium sp. M0145 TaxID=2956895 RepID=UPI0033394367
MRIYAACLASYNNGVLHGIWIDASDDIDAMQAEINAMLRTSRFPNVTVSLPDYETAARAAGWTHETARFTGAPSFQRSGDKTAFQFDSWKDLCESEGIEPAEKLVPSAEEWAIHDSEGLGDLGEYAGLAEVARRASVAELADDRDIPLAVLLQFASDYMNGDWDSADLESEVDERYRGSYDTWRDFAEEFTEETADMNAIPEWLQGHIDWDSIARDFELSGDFTAYRDGEVGSLYLFWAC